MVAKVSLSGLYERSDEAARVIAARTDLRPAIALVLGSGLGAFADELETATAVPYAEIPGFSLSTVEGHVGRLVIGKSGKVPVVAMQGRVHFYEGYSLEEITFPIRVFKLLGVNTLLLTNAAGAINVEFQPGALMVISDHLNLFGDSPLRGQNDNRFGPRFPDLTEVYARDLQEVAVEEGKSMGLEMRRGIYAGLPGPSYETPAEVRMIRTLGADAVGMSTVPEAIVARHMGMHVLGISCISNLAAGLTDHPVDHQEVMKTGERVRTEFTNLLRKIILKLSVVSQ